MPNPYDPPQSSPHPKQTCDHISRWGVNALALQSATGIAIAALMVVDIYFPELTRPSRRNTYHKVVVYIVSGMLLLFLSTSLVAIGLTFWQISQNKWRFIYSVTLLVLMMTYLLWPSVS